MKEKILSARLLNDQLALFYTGQVGFIFKYNEKYVLVDGYLSDYVDRNCCSKEVKWVRKYPTPIKPEELDFIDYVFCTHSHFDHADPDTLSVIAKVNTKAKYFVSAAITDVIEGYGIPKEKITGLKVDEKLIIDEDISVTALPSAHEELNVDGNGDYLEIGFKFEFGDKSVYHSGDCCPYDGLEERINETDILIMPINGRDWYRKNIKDIIGCFDSVEAITIAQNTKAKLLIPVHFDLYSVNEVNPAHFVDCLQKYAPGLPFHIFAPGEGYVYCGL